MSRNHWKSLAAIVSTALVSVLFAPNASADCAGFEIPGTPGPLAFFTGLYSVPTQGAGFFPVPAPWVGFAPPGPTLPRYVPPGAPSGFSMVTGTANCPPCNSAAFIGVHPFVGVVGAGATIVRPAKAGGGPTTLATTPDTLQDSIAVSVNRSVPGQLTISISGYSKHFNPGTVPAASHCVSRLYVTVYPDTTSAKNRVNSIAQGRMSFDRSSTPSLGGLFGPGDFTGPTAIGDGNDFQVVTANGLSKVVTVPNENTAVVEARVDPDAFDAPPPGLPSAPPSWTFVASAALVAGLFVVSRRRRLES